MNAANINPAGQFTMMGLTFHHVLTATKVNGVNKGGPIVLYEENLKSHLSKRGVYVVTVNGEAVYVGKYANSFAKRWLYTRTACIYHHTRQRIAEALLAQHDVRVFAVGEQELQRQVSPLAPNVTPWINAEGIEHALIHALKPSWNVLNG